MRSAGRLGGQHLAQLVSVLVGASDFSDFVSRLDLMRRIGNSDASMVASIKDAKARVEDSKSSLEARQAEQVALRSEARSKGKTGRVLNIRRSSLRKTGKKC